MKSIIKLRSFRLPTKLSGYDCCRLYMAVKLHFSGGWQIQKYGIFYTKLSPASYQKRNDKYIFERISLRFTAIQLVLLFVSNALNDNLQWVGNCTNETGIENFKDIKTRLSTVTSRYNSDIKNILIYCEENGIKFKDIFVSDLDNPLIIKMYLNNYINIETIIILNSFIGFMNHVTEDPILVLLFNQIQKYEKLFDINKVAAREETINIIKSV